MQDIILAGVLDHRPQLVFCHCAADLRGALAAWFGDLVPDLDFADADPQTVEVAIEEAMAPSDWTALECFSMIDDRLAFTGDSLIIGVSQISGWISCPLFVLVSQDKWLDRPCRPRSLLDVTTLGDAACTTGRTARPPSNRVTSCSSTGSAGAAGVMAR